MAIATMAERFAEEADRLPKEAKAKLFKTLRLLTTNPRHPSLQLKKLQGSPRNDVYEVRVDQFWRLIVRMRDNSVYDLIHIGSHDETIDDGLSVREALPENLIAGELAAFLMGGDAYLRFTAWAGSDLAARTALGESEGAG